MYILAIACIIHFRVTFKTAANQTVVNRLVREVKGLNSEFLSQHISGKSSKRYCCLIYDLRFIGYIYMLPM